MCSEFLRVDLERTAAQKSMLRRAVFSKKIGEDFATKFSTVFRALHGDAELSAHRERAAPQKSLLQLDFRKFEFPL
jgi:hypothetical protein